MSGPHRCHILPIIEKSLSKILNIKEFSQSNCGPAKLHLSLRVEDFFIRNLPTGNCTETQAAIGACRENWRAAGFCFEALWLEVVTSSELFASESKDEFFFKFCELWVLMYSGDSARNSRRNLLLCCKAMQAQQLQPDVVTGGLLIHPEARWIQVEA